MLFLYFFEWRIQRGFGGSLEPYFSFNFFPQNTYMFITDAKIVLGRICCK